MPGLGQAEILQGKASDLAHACSGVIQQDEQHPIPAGFRRLPGECCKDRPCFGFGEVLDGRLGVNRGLEGLGCLVERDEGDVFMGCVRQERLSLNPWMGNFVWSSAGSGEPLPGVEAVAHA